MFKVVLCAVLLAQSLIVPLTGHRQRTIQAESLFHTLFHDFFPEDDTTTYVQTGDIPAMWLRDSAAQTIPYVRFQKAFPVLRRRFAGVIERDARAINKDPYANAFEADYTVWERKWEVDSIAWPVLLAYTYIQETGDSSIFTQELHVALRRIVYTYGCEQHHSRCSTYRWPDRVDTDDRYNESSGLIWCAFRPSDDAVRYRFNIPQNMIAAIALREITYLAVRGYGDAQLAQKAASIETPLVRGIAQYGTVYDSIAGKPMYAYETDGYGHDNLMDDANIPNLTTLPAINWSSAYDPVYRATRQFALSFRNPYYFRGRYAEGLGSPHTPNGYVWPLGLIGAAMTDTNRSTVLGLITTLAETDSEQGLLHESFYADGYWRFTRQEFGWANAFWAELIFRTLAGMPAKSFVPVGDVMLPYERPTLTPTLVSPLEQIENAAALNAALRRLLMEGRDAAINQE
ncbi:MAG TPA: glycoside hydrolase family 125 protein [Candidatus Aquilonibacter sp.]|nr:glycoside hydrolase family 125 protein [Candidatus Aquilonibacter sp.]